MNRRTIIIGVIVLAVIAVPVAWWLASPLFVDETVDEAFPFDVPTSEEIKAMSAAEAETAVSEIMAEVSERSLTDAQMGALEDRLMEMVAMMPDKEMDEPMPNAATEWTVVAQGTFRDADSFHQGSGSATIFQQGDQRVLRFEDFAVTNGPDLHVLLVDNIEVSGRDDIGEMIDLGSLKGNVGSQNYEIPADVDLDGFEGVMIYCVPFHVVFSTAPFG